MPKNTKPKKDLRARLLKEQQRQADRERKLPFTEKMRILDRLMSERRQSQES